MAKWIQSKHEGIRFREHEERKFGIRKDRYYTLRLYVTENGQRKRVEESLGWESDWKHSHPAGTISLEQEAVRRRAELLKNHQEGTGPATLREQRAENRARREADKRTAKAKIDAQKTLSEYFRETYYPTAQRSKKQGSSGNEERHFRIWIEPVMGGLSLQDIDLPQWDELVKTLSNAGRSQRTKEYVTGTLRRILKHAYDRRMAKDPPPTGRRVGVTGPGNNRRLRVISHEEERAIMENLHDSDPHAWRITRFAFLTGCRASEAFNLTWGNVDLSQGRILFAETKNRDSRIIPVTQPLQELFTSMAPGTPSTHVFVKANGSRYEQAPSAFETVVKHLGLNEGRGKRDRLVFHSIRHTVATRLARRLGPRDLMDVMGWRTVQMAMRYVHGNEAAKMAALSMLGTEQEAGKVLPFEART